MDIGDTVTNGYWTGKIVGKYGPFAWVQPETVKTEDGRVVPYLYDDGPLTFVAKHLKRT